MKFVDLFAGLGGFHVALNQMGHECVFACEIDPVLNHLYQQNFGMRCEGDIRAIDAGSIPSHDILCAGFPCQPFSKAGSQRGFGDQENGDLFDHIIRVLKFHRPQFLVLENVPNLVRHGKQDTYKLIREKLQSCGYAAPQFLTISPHFLGVPQTRKRVFIVDSRDTFSMIVPPSQPSETHISSILQANPEELVPISDQAARAIDSWQDFIDLWPEEYLPSFPIWSMEFGSNYPHDERTPYSLAEGQLMGYRGQFGTNITADFESAMHLLPGYARTRQDVFPSWKIKFIDQNRALYSKHRHWIDEWLPAMQRLPASFQKLEWNAKGFSKQLDQTVVQLRPSGIRAKRPNTSPALVAMTTTQVPIIPWQSRHLSISECAALQSFDRSDFVLPPTRNKAYSALGNAVNVKVAQRVAELLLSAS
jgi:DNA (cytosine-5)-methyltransferase 1